MRSRFTLLAGFALVVGCTPGGSSTSSSSSSSSGGASASSSSSGGAGSSSSSGASSSSSGQTTSSGGADAGIPDAGCTCPDAGSEEICASNGSRYPSACFAACAGATVVPCYEANPDAGTCGAEPLVPGSDTQSLTLTTIHGSANPLSPVAEEKGGEARPVNLQRAGLSENEDHVALLQVTESGVKLVALDAVDAALGTLPVELADHVYALGTAPLFGPLVPALVVIPPGSPALSSSLGEIDAVAVVNTGADLNPDKLHVVKLVEEPVATPPVAAAPLVASDSIPGFPSPNVALVDGRYLHVREDGTQSVLAYDLMDLPQGGVYPRVSSREFSASTAGLSNGFLNALTREANPVTGELAVTYSDFTGAAGVFVFNPENGAFSHARLPRPGEGLSLDLPAVAWSNNGTRLLVAWDAYDGNFTKVQSRLVAFDTVEGADPSLVDAFPDTADVVDPVLAVDLPEVHPTNILVLPSSTDDVEDVVVVQSPYGAPATRLDLLRITGCAAYRMSGVGLGSFSADLPSLELLSAGQRDLLVVGTASGIQIYEINGL
ncbi:MAG: Kazal-type serine protease inhibitor domain-containing protein [Myxococcota bacterium]